MTDFALKMEGHQAVELNEWRRARFLAFHIVNMSGKMVKKKLRETDILELPEDKVKKKIDPEAFKKEQEEKLKRYEQMNWNKTSVTGKKKK